MCDFMLSPSIDSDELESRLDGGPPTIFSHPSPIPVGLRLPDILRQVNTRSMLTVCTVVIVMIDVVQRVMAEKSKKKKRIRLNKTSDGGCGGGEESDQTLIIISHARD